MERWGVVNGLWSLDQHEAGNWKRLDLESTELLTRWRTLANELDQGSSMRCAEGFGDVHCGLWGRGWWKRL